MLQREPRQGGFSVGVSGTPRPARPADFAASEARRSLARAMRERIAAISTGVRSFRGTLLVMSRAALPGANTRIR